ncbi:MAG: gamma-glutamyltransferase family protein [Pseudomonadota bacterium]
MLALRPTITGTRGVVASTHYLASMAGHAMLEAGGNAVDAGVAAGIALGVVQSELVGFAGVAPIIFRDAASGRVSTIAGLGGWPRALDPEFFVREHGGRIPPGVLRSVVPAAPDAWIRALATYGTMSFADVAAPAIRFAGEGFVIDPMAAEFLEEHADLYARFPSSAAIYLPGGRPPRPGDVFLQADLGRTLQYMADEEGRATAHGREAGLQAARDAFYRGDIAATILRFYAEQGGLLAAEDLAAYESPIEPAVSVRWRGSNTVHVCGAWCQGPAFAETLKILETSELGRTEMEPADRAHLVIEALKLALWDREAHIGDPRFVDVPLARLLSDAYTSRLLAGIDPRRALDTEAFAERLQLGADGPLDVPPREPDTAYCCAIDRWGNVFSCTPSDGSFHVPVVPGTGLVVSQRGAQSRPDPRHPSGVAPGKRPRLTPNPAIAELADGRIMAFGTPGGDVQIQAMLQVFLNHVVDGLALQEAIEAPRIASFSFPSSFAPFECKHGVVRAEAHVDAAIRDGLAARGHLVETWPAYDWRAGGVCAATLDPTRMRMSAAADPRRPSYAVGW